MTTAHTVKVKTVSLMEPLKLDLVKGAKIMMENGNDYSTKLEDTQNYPDLDKLNHQDPSLVSSNAQIPIESNDGAINISQSADKVSSISELDFDLDQLEDSIKFFDLKDSTNAMLPHSLGYLSSHYDRNDSETLGEHNSLNEDVNKKKTFLRSLSTGVIKDTKFTDGKMPKSASTLSWLNYDEARTTHPSYPNEKDDSIFSSVSAFSSSKSSSPLENWKLNGQGSVIWKNEELGPDEVNISGNLK